MEQYQPNKEELSAIKKNNIEFFQKPYNDREKQGFLRESIARGQFNIIKFFIEQGVPVVNNTCLDSLAEKKGKLKVFEYLHEKGIDIAPRGNLPFLRACMALNVTSANYLQTFSSLDDLAFTRTLTYILYREKNAQEKTPITEFEPILNILLKNISSNQLDKILNIEGTERIHLVEDNKKYIFNLHLSLQIPDSAPLPRKKI